MTAETWRDVPSAPGYQVSDQGRVRSTRNRWKAVEPHLLRATRNSHGYLTCSVYVDGRERKVKVHLLVMEAFVGPRPEGLETRHLDGDQENNALSNLEYGTPSQNQLDRLVHGTNQQANKTHCPQNHPYDEANTYFEDNGRTRKCKTCVNARNRANYHRRAREVRQSKEMST